MFGTAKRGALLAALCSLLLAACGGKLDVYNYGDAGTDGGELPLVDAGDNTGATDMSSRDEGRVDIEPDAGSGEMPDMATLDMEVSEPVDPTTNVPQSGPSVADQITTQCSTIAVKGLSLQLIEQMNCEDPGVMKSFEGAAGITYGASVFPFQQGPATDALVAAAASKAGSIPINSALRTLPQQYLLYEWYNRGLCNANLAAPPGRSNHNGGLAVDIGDSSVWRSEMRNRSYIDNVSGEPWHFFFTGAGGKDVRNLSVLAFQKLYNRNFPEDPIDTDGLYGPQTEGALRSAPANGFTVGPRCTATMMMVAYPHRAPLEVHWERIADGFLGIRTVAPSGIRLVQYYLNGRLLGFSDQGDGGQFETVLEIPRDIEFGARLEVVAHDAWGVEKGRAIGLVDGWSARVPVFVRPLGGVNYEIGLEEIPRGVAAVEYYIDGIPTTQKASLAVSPRRAKRLAVQLDGEHLLDIVLLDKRDRIKRIITRRVDLRAEE